MRPVGAGGGVAPKRRGGPWAAAALKIYKVKKTRARVTVVDNDRKALSSKASKNHRLGDVTKCGMGDVTCPSTENMGDVTTPSTGMGDVTIDVSSLLSLTFARESGMNRVRD